ncbi:MAG: Na/Pi symporter [Porticoccaceae bacterium]|nr:Na/Pi symporter [Porticoccaceae bacterium]
MSTTGILTFIGGIGLFLLGMRLMTDGLKVAAGDTLRAILTTATRSPGRGLASGVLITAMVQSSGAVIFATIGFVNAGLLTLSQSIGIILGSNLGTTLTSWIVALLGFNVDLQTMAMPAVGLGMALWIAFGSLQRGALGQALVGFGIFFLGIDVLRDSFTNIGDVIELEGWADRGGFSLLIFTLIGLFMTILMQSSSAALAVTLTAAAGGLIPFNAAAAMIIGANVGTTSTAALAVIGATAPAKRAASAHVIFNIITAIVAFTLLAPLLWLVSGIAALFGFASQIAVLLAIFHTMTKLLGIAITWPLLNGMVAFLERRFRSIEEDQSRPKYLDSNILAAPALALDALILELKRMSQIARHLAQEAISAENGSSEHMNTGRNTLDKLNGDISEFVSGMARYAAESRVANLLPDALRVSHYLVEVSESALVFSRLHAQAIVDDPGLLTARNELWRSAVSLLSRTDMETTATTAAELQHLRDGFEHDYQSLKSQLLRAGTTGALTPRRMALLLEQLSALHRIVDQATKSALYLERVISQHLGKELPPAATVSDENRVPDQNPPSTASALYPPDSSGASSENTDENRLEPTTK